MLGIIIGVGSVIVMVAVGAGARSEVDRQISQLGTNVLVVNPSARVYGGRSSGPGTNLPLSEDDLKAIETKVQGVVAISGQLWASATVVRGNANTWTRIWGVHEQYLELRNWSVEAGREIYRSGHRHGQAGGAHGPVGGEGAVRRQRPRGTDVPHQECAIHSDRRLERQGPERHRRGPRLQHSRAHDDSAHPHPGSGSTIRSARSR